MFKATSRLHDGGSSKIAKAISGVAQDRRGRDRTSSHASGSHPFAGAKLVFFGRPATSQRAVIAVPPAPSQRSVAKEFAAAEHWRPAAGVQPWREGVPNSLGPRRRCAGARLLPFVPYGLLPHSSTNDHRSTPCVEGSTLGLLQYGEAAVGVSMVATEVATARCVQRKLSLRAGQAAHHTRPRMAQRGSASSAGPCSAVSHRYNTKRCNYPLVDTQSTCIS